jgi:glycogen operon protein
VGSPLGVTIAGDGIDVAVHAPNADAIALCVFDADGHETGRHRLPDRTGPVFHGHIAGVPPGTRYGLRAYGPWDPRNGHRFNPSKLLMDPWATAIDRPFRLDPLLFDRDGPRPDDTAALMPKAIAGAATPTPITTLPAFKWDRQVVYELHVRGFSMTHADIPPAIRGTYAALAHPAAIRHLTRLGISTVELMPSAAWVDERHLPALNRSNYWGYNPIAYLAPDPRLAPGGWPEIRTAVDALHNAGLNVILDVVLNHSGESDELGPTLSMRGLDNAAYYRLAADRSLYANDAGCGNILAMDRPALVRLGMDALRAWALYGGFDGFRLDLATTLGRRDTGFDPNAAFLQAVEQDPVLSCRAMIAEPWDIGAGGYQLGAFPARWGEWNDRFRNSTRRFWRGDPGMLGEFTTRFAGSADIFARRPLSRAINYITAHDGFTLADLVAYETKHNQANGEDNRDGSDDNLSWNNGTEGASSDPSILAARSRDVRALLATLLLSRGTPMLSMGDELGRTQSGNNNAYAQDNAGSWIDWSTADGALVDFTAELIAVRRSLAPLFNDRELQGRPAGLEVVPDVAWYTVDGRVMTEADWNRDTDRTLVAVLYANDVRAALVFHADATPVAIALPEARPGHAWSRVLDSAIPREDLTCAAGLTIQARSVTVFQEAVHAVVAGLVPAIDPPAAGAPATGTGSATRVGGKGPTDAELDQLAQLAGIDLIWWDVDGGYHKVAADTKRALLAAMRLPAATRGDLGDSMARLTLPPILPPTLSASPQQAIAVKLGQPRPAWVTLLREDGSLDRFQPAEDTIVLPPQPIGRHRILNEDRPEHPCHLTVAPDTCYLPPTLRAPTLLAPTLLAPTVVAGERCFGIAAHLYALRSTGDQGIGDFTTLTRLAAQAARSGAAVVGLNPLHALFPHDRSRASPYQPSDRRFLDPIYIDVAGFPGGGDIPSPPGPVDYPAVWEAKRAVLRAAFTPGDGAAILSGPIAPGLLRFATFEAIAETLGTSNWLDWPAELRHPADPGVTAFVAQHPDAVAFHAFLQRLADQQLADAAASASRNGLSIGFYRDLAVGAAPDGAEAWSAQDTLMHGVSVGAPPDPFATQGQIWCLPPPDPIAMRRDGYTAFRELLVANMRHAGALRIDHVMGLRRLFIIPDGANGMDGAYVTYPLADLLAQVRLESHRSRCLVVGEDLGTVPEGMSETLAASNILSYSVLWFQRRDGHIRPPAEWRRLAAACVSTHDLATLAGWWNGTDIAEKRALSLLDDSTADHAIGDQAIGDEISADQVRANEKAEMIGLLRQEGLLSRDVDPNQPMPSSFAAAVHALVAATPALLALVQADDLAGETVAVNLPGTDRERPNWRRRLDVDVSDLCETPLARAILATMASRAGPGDAAPRQD